MPIARPSKTLTIAGLAAMLAAVSNASAQQDPLVVDADSRAEPGTAITPIRKGIDPAADRILRDWSEFLASFGAFTVSVEIAEDVLLPHGQTVQHGGVSELVVQRPGSLHASFRGEARRTEVIIHDGHCTLHDLNGGVFAVTEVPPLLDDAVDRIVEQYGLNVPVADIIYRDPYSAVISAVDYGFVVGRSSIGGVDCHHLAFAQETIDWQVWIQSGPRPLLRKLVITYKDEPGWPEYTARFTRWELEPWISRRHFEFKPPADVDQVDFLPNQRVEDNR